MIAISAASSQADDGQVGEDQPRAQQPHDAAQDARRAARGVVLFLFDALQEPGWFSDPPHELAHDIRRPPEAAEQHDAARQCQRQAPQGEPSTNPSATRTTMVHWCALRAVTSYRPIDE